MSYNFEVLSPGLFTTVQDLGRLGHKSQGIAVNGAFDIRSARMANLMVNNDENDALLEFTNIGPTIKFFKHSIIAITGGEFEVYLNETPIKNQLIKVQEHDTLQIKQCLKGYRGYLAIMGGLEIEPIYLSKSTNAKANFGGFHGRSLLKCDILSWNPVTKYFPPLRNLRYNRYFAKHFTARVIPGPEWDWFDSASKSKIMYAVYQVTSQSDRGGIRLMGEPLTLENQQELISSGTDLGVIQVPHSGQPIILGPDGPTSGGYPRIGTVIREDLWDIAQLAPGNTLSFTYA